MAEETISIDLQSNSDEFFQKLNAQLEEAGKKFAKSLTDGVATATQAANTGTAATREPSLVGAAKAGVGALADGIAHGIASTPFGASAGGFAGHAAFGAAESIGSVASRGAGAALGGAIGGPAGAAAGSAVFGALADRSFAALEEKFYGPERSTNSRLGGYYGELARYGIAVSDEQIRRSAQRSLEGDRRQQEMQRRIERITSEQNSWFSGPSTSTSLFG